MIQLQIEKWISCKCSPHFKTCRGWFCNLHISNSLFHFAAVAAGAASTSPPCRGEGHDALRREEQVIAFMNVNHVPEVAALKGDDKTRRDESDWRTLERRESTNDKSLCACLTHIRVSIKCLTQCSNTSSYFYMPNAQTMSTEPSV